MNVRLYFFIVGVLASWLCFSICPVRAQASARVVVAMVVAARGEISAINPNGEVRKLWNKESVYLKDIIKTGKRGRLQILFSDNTLISLGSRSEMKIAEYFWQANVKKGEIRTEVKEGLFRVMGGEIAKFSPKKFKTITPTATIGIRGSMYSGVASLESLSVVFLGGKGIEVSNQFGGVAITKPGFGTHVKVDAPPLSQVKFSEQDLVKLDEALVVDKGGGGETSASEGEPEGGGDDTPQAPSSDNGGTTDGDGNVQSAAGGISGNTPNNEDVENAGVHDFDRATESVEDGAGAGQLGYSGGLDGATGGEFIAGVAVVAAVDSTQETLLNDNDGNAIVGYDQGVVVISNPDGSRTIIDSDGSATTLIPDGGSATDNPDGSTVTPNQDGSTTTDNPDGSSTVTLNPDGSITTVNPDGSTVILNPDGSTTTIDPDGTTVTTGAPPPPPPPPSPPPPVTLNMSSGHYLNAWYDGTTTGGGGDGLTDLSASAVSTNGSLAGAADDGGTPVFPFFASVAPYSSTGTYTGYVLASPVSHTVNLLGVDWGISGLTYSYDNLGEFAAFSIESPAGSFDAGNHTFREFGYVGDLATSRPADGVYWYDGEYLFVRSDVGNSNIETSDGSMEMGVNWKLNKVVGYIAENPVGSSSPKVYFYGDIDAGLTSLSNIKLIGSGLQWQTNPGGAGVDAISGDLNFANFYGAWAQGFGIDVVGKEYFAGDDPAVTAQGDLLLTGAAFWVDTYTTLSGTSTWSGFLTGSADNMTSPAPKLYINSDPAALSVIVDRDSGTVTGQFGGGGGVFVAGGSPAYTITGMTLGGTSSSYVFDDRFIATLDCPSCFSDGSTWGDNSYSNFMTTAPVGEQFSAVDAYSWGTWQVAYVDPNDGYQYWFDRPSSLWIAGEKVPTAYISSLMATSGLSGKFSSGKAKGFKTTAAGVTTELTSGTADLTVYFDEAVLFGDVGFNEAVVKFISSPSHGGTFTADGFSVLPDLRVAGNLIPITGGEVNGTYFGDSTPSLAAVGGNFWAKTSVGEMYSGIFGADLAGGTTFNATNLTGVTGKHLAILTDTDLANDTNDRAWSGAVAADFLDGTVVGHSPDALESPLGSAKDFPLLFSGAVYNPGASFVLHNDPASLTREFLAANSNIPAPSEGLYSFDSGTFRYSDLGEFGIYSQFGESFDAGSYDFAELGFTGVLASPGDRANTGVQSYKGVSLREFQSTAGATIEANGGDLFVVANWHNDKIFGLVSKGGAPLTPGMANDGYYFFGDIVATNSSVDDSSITVTGFGDSALSSGPDAITEAATPQFFGQFYGSAYQGVGVSTEGRTFAIDSQVVSGDWSAVAAAHRDTSDPYFLAASPIGSVSWEGFVTGMAENLSSGISTDRLLFMNTVSSDFSWSVDRDAGTIAGQLNADNTMDANYSIDNLIVGSPIGSSAYVHDKALVSEVGSTGVGGGVAYSGNNQELKAYGNYLVTDPTVTKLCDYASWGYWEVAFDAPATAPSSGDAYHLHAPGSLWVAGELSTFVGSLITPGGFSGTYNGKVVGVEIAPDITGTVTPLTQGGNSWGGISLNIDFDSGNTAPVTGSFGWDQGVGGFTINPVGSTVSSSGFAASVTGANSSVINGAFYGPASGVNGLPGSVAGNFHAEMTAGGVQYLGVFGADLQ